MVFELSCLDLLDEEYKHSIQFCCLTTNIIFEVLHLKNDPV